MANRSNYYPRTLRLQSWEVQNGKVQGLLEVKNGYEEGINTIYYENGNIEYEKYVSNNGRLVYEKHFYQNGQIDFEATYKDGQLDGIVKKYGSNGQVAQQGIFKDGVQVQ